MTAEKIGPVGKKFRYHSGGDVGVCRGFNLAVVNGVPRITTLNIELRDGRRELWPVDRIVEVAS
jgi:hypothetical protein